MKFYLMWANHDVSHLWDVRLSSSPVENTIWKAAVDRAEFGRVHALPTLHAGARGAHDRTLRVSNQLPGFGRRLTSDIYPSDFKFLPRLFDRDRRVVQSDSWANAANYRSETAGTRPWSVGIDYDEETHFRAVKYLFEK